MSILKNAIFHGFFSWNFRILTAGGRQGWIFPESVRRSRDREAGPDEATGIDRIWCLQLVEIEATKCYSIHEIHTKEAAMKIAEASGICKNYPSFSLKDVSFSLEEGKITGFIGRNGAGKTTTIKSMLNLIHTDGGEITYFGLPLRGHEEEIKQRIGYSTGTVSWYPRKKIREILNVSRCFYRSWDEEACRKYLTMFGLDENRKPIEMSEGMKVKFNLLLALSHRAEVLILDEPTSGLDPFSRDELLELFMALKEKGVTIFFSTHITSDLERCADRLIYISRGRIRADDSKADFMRTTGLPGETLEEVFLRLERGSLE